MSKLRERVLAELFAERDAEIARLRADLAAASAAAERCKEALRLEEARARRLAEDRDEESALRERLAQLLAHTAGALKGRPRPLHAHDWSDMPRVAAALRRERDALKRASTEETPARCRACGALLVEQTATHCWPQCQANLRARVLDSLHVYHDFRTRTDGAPEMYAYLRFVPEDMEPFRHGLSTGVTISTDDRGSPLPDELRRAKERVADWMVAAWESLLEKIE